MAKKIPFPTPDELNLPGGGEFVFPGVFPLGTTDPALPPAAPDVHFPGEDTDAPYVVR